MSEEGPEVPPSGDAERPEGEAEHAAPATPAAAAEADPATGTGTSTGAAGHRTGTPDGTTGSRLTSGSESGRGASGRRPPSLPNAPKQIGDFEVVRRLGTGGMAEVFLAKKRGAEGTYKLLVLKRVLPDYVSSRRFRVMFADEAQLATRLNHPNIVQIYDFQDYGDEGQLLSMEYVDGPDLRALTKAAKATGERLPPPVAAYIVLEVAKGLHYAHERKDERGAPLDIVHRDVSPQNVLLSYDGAVKVADFGIASANLFREEEGVLKGKTGYMSPEQAAGQKVDRRTDIYSLGVILHELLTGRPLHGPLEGDALLEAVRVGRVEPPSTYALGIPSELDDLTLKALAVDPAKRFQTARDFSVALGRALFQMGEIVDAHVLETTIVSLLGERAPDGGAEAHGHEGTGESQGGSAPVDAAEGTPVEPLLAGREAGREVRHVAVVSLGLTGQAQLSTQLGREAALAAFERLVSTLDAIAFKRNMRVHWQRDDVGFPTHAHAVAGLLSNPTSAAADAVWFAVDVHDGVGAARDDLDAEFRARIGIVRSLASGRRDPSGHLIDHELPEGALVLAELLRRRASPGVSLVAGGLYRLVRRDFLWGDAPTIEPDMGDVPDLPPRMRVYQLLRGLTREEKLEEVAAAPNELIGRDAEIADLHAAYFRVVGQAPGEGQTSALVVSGELGIGKSALVNAFVNELPPDARVLRAECSKSRQDVPYGILADMLRELTGTTPDQPLPDALRQVAQALSWDEHGEGHAILLRLSELCTGRLGEVYDDVEVGHQRQQILAGYREFVARASDEGPLVIVVDALEWCDEGSLSVLVELGRSDMRLPVLLLFVTRPEKRITPFVDGLLRLDLAGLTPENQARLLQVRLGVGPGVERGCADVFPRAAGNPYFLLEMVDALLERGVLEIREQDSGPPALERIDVAGSVVTLPTTLEQLLADRLTELSEEEQHLLDWLAVAGAALRLADLRQLFGHLTDDVLRRLGERGFVEVKDEMVDVRHPLARDVAYRSMLPEVRQRLHRGLGEFLAASGQNRGLGAAAVARHLAKGGNNDQAAELYLEAAGVARASYQMDIATRSYRKVVAILPKDDLRLLEAHEALEAIMRNDGHWKERRLHLDQLRLLAAKSAKGYWVATALLRSARFELDTGHLARAAELGHLSEAGALQAGSQVVALQARSLLAEVLRDLGDMQGALSAVDRALADADHPDVTSRLRAEVLRAKGTLLRRVGRVVEALDAYAESIAVFQQVGARRMEARAKSSMAFALYALGRYEDGILLANQAIQIDSAIGGRFQTAKTLANKGLCYAGAGDHETALQYLTQAREAHERYGERDSRADTLLSTAEVLLERGDLDQAAHLVGDAGALIRLTESRYDAIHERLLRALLAEARGNSREAVQRAMEARQGAEGQAYASFHFYAMAIEGKARVDVGEEHTGILLATTALGALETLQGSEYSLDTRALAVAALERARSPQAGAMRRRSAKVAQERADGIRDPNLWRAFLERRPVVQLLGRRGDPPAIEPRGRLFT